MNHLFLVATMSTFLLVGASGQSSGVASSTDFPSLDKKDIIISSHYNKKNQRNIAISSTCESEISEILTKSALLPNFEVSTWPQEVLGSACVISGSSNFTCDYSQFGNANDNLQQACVTADGRPVEVTYIMSGSFSGTLIRNEINNMGVCIGSSCDPDEVAAYIADYATILFIVQGGSDVDVLINVTNYMTSAPTISQSPTISLSPTPGDSSSSIRFSSQVPAFYVLAFSLFVSVIMIVLA